MQLYLIHKYAQQINHSEDLKPLLMMMMMKAGTHYHSHTLESAQITHIVLKVSYVLSLFCYSRLSKTRLHVSSHYRCQI